MSYLYKNNFIEQYDADVGSIVKINDSDSIYNNKLMYMPGSAFNGYCYKDYNNFKNNPDEVCYIAECSFDDTLFVDYVKENKDKLIKKGGLSTTNSIKEEIKNQLEHEEYYYEYEKDGIVHTIESKNFDDKLITQMAEYVFDVVDWQTTQAYIYETNWCEDIKEYYDKKIQEESKLYEL